MEPKKEMLYALSITLAVLVLLTIIHNPVFGVFHISFVQIFLFILSSFFSFFYANKTLREIKIYAAIMSAFYFFVFIVEFIIDKNVPEVVMTNSFLHLFLFGFFFYLYFGKNSEESYWMKIE